MKSLNINHRTRIKIDVDERIRLIDEMLKRPELTEQAIDNLLDERNQLLNLKKVKSEK